MLHGCNWQWWHRRWDVVKDLPAEKWTTNRQAADTYGINWIDQKPGFGEGLSTDPSYLYHGHGSGFQLLGMAYRARPERIVLLGYDLKYAPDYDGRNRQIGSSPRHFFGEYEPELGHWPSKMIERGVHIELVGLYTSVAEQNPCQIINCTPDTALECFQRADIDDL